MMSAGAGGRLLETVATAADGQNYTKLSFSTPPFVNDSEVVYAAVVVSKRSGGFLLALPTQDVPVELLDAAVSSESSVGPSTVAAVRARSVANSAKPFTFRFAVVLVDFLTDAGECLAPWSDSEAELSDAVLFATGRGGVPAWPVAEELVGVMREWVIAQGDDGRASGYATAVEPLLDGEELTAEEAENGVVASVAAADGAQPSHKVRSAAAPAAQARGNRLTR